MWSNEYIHRLTKPCQSNQNKTRQFLLIQLPCTEIHNLNYVITAIFLLVYPFHALLWHVLYIPVSLPGERHRWKDFFVLGQEPI